MIYLDIYMDRRLNFRRHTSYILGKNVGQFSKFASDSFVRLSFGEHGNSRKSMFSLSRCVNFYFCGATVESLSLFISSRLTNRKPVTHNGRDFSRLESERPIENWISMWISSFTNTQKSLFTFV